MDNVTRTIIMLVAVHGIKDWDEFINLKMLSKDTRDIILKLFRLKRDELWRLENRCVWDDSQYYILGKRGDGKCEIRTLTGLLVERSNWKNGEMNGLYEEWYPNGKIFIQCSYKDDKRYGSYKEWYINGRPNAQYNYIDDKKDGLSEEWWDNGQLYIRSNWKDGKMNGLREMWYGDGQLRDRSYWKDGVQINIELT